MLLPSSRHTKNMLISHQTPYGHQNRQLDRFYDHVTNHVLVIPPIFVVPPKSTCKNKAKLRCTTTGSPNKHNCCDSATAFPLHVFNPPLGWIPPRPKSALTPPSNLEPNTEIQQNFTSVPKVDGQYALGAMKNLAFDQDLQFVEFLFFESSFLFHVAKHVKCSPQAALIYLDNIFAGFSPGEADPKISTHYFLISSILCFRQPKFSKFVLPKIFGFIIAAESTGTCFHSEFGAKALSMVLRYP